MMGLSDSERISMTCSAVLKMKVKTLVSTFKKFRYAEKATT